MSDRVLVFGAYGHTGRFVVGELVRRGITPVLSGRDPGALAGLRDRYPELEARLADAADPESLSRAVEDVAVVVNCAGPFLDTGVAVAGAAVGAGAHYLDVAAEQAAVQAVYRAHEERGWRADLAVVPAMAFYGGLADLLATSAMDDWEGADEVTVAVGLDRWWPTEGTRRTGARNSVPRVVVEDGRLAPAPAEAATVEWEFPEPLGRQTLVGAPFSEMVTIHRHLRATRVRSYLSKVALDDIRDPATPPPEALDESGRSPQRFVVDVEVRRGDERRRAAAAGRDIYAATAPLVGEATSRLLDGRAVARGAAAPGEVFDAADFLDAVREDLAADRS